MSTMVDRQSITVPPGYAQELVVLSASSKVGSPLQVWKPDTLSVLHSWKDCACARRGLTRVGDKGFVAARSDRPAVQLRSWSKQGSSKKSAMAERVGPMATTGDGHYVVGGGSSGKLYIWETQKGSLIRIWDGHYKSITSLHFNADCTLLFTAGEDGVVHSWDLFDILGSLDGQCVPVRSFRGHTLPITDMCVSFGSLGGGSRIFTASSDQTARVYETSSSSAILVVSFPAMLRAVATDRQEHRMYLGGNDGAIYSVDLHAASASQTAASLKNASAGRGDGAGVAAAAVAPATMRGHEAAIASLVTTYSGRRLISGDEKGAVFVWDTLSRQQLRSFGGHSGMGAVSSLLVMPLRTFLLLQNGSPGSSPLPPLKKFANAAKYLQSDDVSVDIALGTPSLRSVDVREGDDGTDTRIRRVETESAQFDDARGNTTEIDILKAKLLELEGDVGRWKHAASGLFELSTECMALTKKSTRPLNLRDGGSGDVNGGHRAKKKARHAEK